MEPERSVTPYEHQQAPPSPRPVVLQNYGCLIAAAVLALSVMVAAAIGAFALLGAGRSLGEAVDRNNPANILWYNF